MNNERTQEKDARFPIDSVPSLIHHNINTLDNYNFKSAISDFLPSLLFLFTSRLLGSTLEVDTELGITSFLPF
jgi:hypothetical protein